MGRPFFARPNRQKQLLAVREPARHSEKSEDSALGTVILVVRCARRVREPARHSEKSEDSALSTVVLVVRCARRVRRVKGTQTQKVIVLDS